MSEFICPNGCCPVVMAWMPGKAVRQIQVGDETFYGIEALARHFNLGTTGARGRLRRKACLRESKWDAYSRASSAQARKAAEEKHRAERTQDAAAAFLRMRW